MRRDAAICSKPSELGGKARWRWWVSKAAAGDVSVDIERALGGQGRHQLLGSSMVREVALAELPGYGEVVIKRYLPAQWPKALWNALRGSQWRREWRSAQRLRELGIPTPEPLAMGERSRWRIPEEGLLVSRAIQNALTLTVYLAEKQRDPGPVLRALGNLLAEMHNLGVLHRDLHAGNLLVAEPGERCLEFWILDLHRVRTGRGPVAHAQRKWNLAQLLVSLRGSLEPGQEEVLLRSYIQRCGLGGSESSWAFQLRAIQERMARRRYRSRTRRCLQESTRFAVEAIPGGKVIRLRSFPLGKVLRAMEEAGRVTDPGDPRALKLTSRTRVTVQEMEVEGALQRICVKEHRSTGVLSRVFPAVLNSRGRRFWVGAWGLMVRGFQVPSPMAMWERKHGGFRSSGVVMEMVQDGIGLSRFVASPCMKGREGRRFVEEFARTLARMHELGVFHRDLKAGNIMVVDRGDAHSVLFLDLEDVRFQKRVTARQVALNLAQLDASIPDCVGWFSRLRFLCMYAKGSIGGVDLRELAQRASRISQERKSPR